MVLTVLYMLTAFSVEVSAVETLVEEECESVYMMSPQIDRTGAAYCPGNGEYGIIYGDNNWLGENIMITNYSASEIEVKGYTEYGWCVRTIRLTPGETDQIGFCAWDGEYYFKVRYTNNSSGVITIHMKTSLL